MNNADQRRTKDNTAKVAEKSNKGLMKWLKRLGVAGFTFFLVKGILWLTVGAAVLRYFGCED